VPADEGKDEPFVEGVAQVVEHIVEDNQLMADTGYMLAELAAEAHIAAAAAAFANDYFEIHSRNSHINHFVQQGAGHSACRRIVDKPIIINKYTIVKRILDKNKKHTSNTRVRHVPIVGESLSCCEKYSSTEYSNKDVRQLFKSRQILRQGSNADQNMLIQWDNLTEMKGQYKTTKNLKEMTYIVS
jgi:hypothetical protein